MHDTRVIIRNVHVPDNVPGILFKVVVKMSWDIGADDLNVLISVGSRLLVVQSQGVTYFVDYHAFLRNKIDFSDVLSSFDCSSNIKPDESLNARQF